MKNGMIRVGLVAVCGCAVGILAIALFASQQLSLLSAERMYETPAAGLIELYGGESRVEMTGQGTEVEPGLQYVSATVESGHCRGRGRCPVGGFFLKMDAGWVFVPEGRYPWLIAAGKKLLELRRSS